MLHSQRLNSSDKWRNQNWWGMGNLKDEIEKLVQLEEKNIESKNKKNSEFHERQRERFAPLRTTLEEIVNAIDPSLVQAKIRVSSARLEIGRTRNGHFRAETRWEIEPSYRHPDGIAGDRAEESGFAVEATTYFQFADVDHLERSLTFKNDQALVDYLMGEIAKKIARGR